MAAANSILSLKTTSPAHCSPSLLCLVSFEDSGWVCTFQWYQIKLWTSRTVLNDDNLKVSFYRQTLSNNSNFILICVSKKSKKTNYQTCIVFIVTYFRMFLIYSRLILWHVKTKEHESLCSIMKLQILTIRQESWRKKDNFY